MTDFASKPATDASAITPHDSDDLAKVPRALYVGTAGDVKVDMADGTAGVIFVGAIGILPIRVTRVYATLTTASDIVGLY
jgi:hypothetical protein